MLSSKDAPKKADAKLWTDLTRSDEYLVVNTMGHVVQAPNERHGCAQMGVCVVDCQDGAILLCIDEVSDDEVINAFLWTPGEVITSVQVEEGIENPSATHEIIMDRPGTI